METLVLCDTNILIDVSRGVERVIDELKQIEEKNIAVSVVSAGEFIYGAFNKQELQQILRSLEQVKLLAIDEEIGNLHLKLLTTYALSHDLSVPDALIAATAIHHTIQLFTLNRKDFQYIPEVNLYVPSWEK